MPFATLCVAEDAERPELHAYAERWHDVGGASNTHRSSQAAAAILLISRCPLDETCKVLDSSVVRSQPI